MSTELRGISINVTRPRDYLAALRAAIADGFRSWIHAGAVIAQIDAALNPDEEGALAEPKRHLVLGHNSLENLAASVDREWLDGDEDEIDALVSVLEGHRVLDSDRTVFVLGANVCRLPDRLIGVGRIERVIAADLSWVGLSFGRLLIEGKAGELPAEMLADRLLFDAKDGRVVRRLEPPRFRSSRGAGRIDFAVVDAFHLKRIAADTIILNHVLDDSTGKRLESMLVRICRSLAVGQSLVVVTALVDPGRTPVQVRSVLESCGFTLENAVFARLPYSFDRFDFATERWTWSGLVVRARKTREIDPRNISINVASAERAGEIAVDRIHAELIRACRERQMTCADLESLSKDAEAIDEALGYLLSRGSLGLEVRAT